MTAVAPRGRPALDPVANLDTATLVTQAKGGDHDAWETLYRRAYPGLASFASRRLDPDRARDAVAETMARAVASIDRFTWKGSGFDGWLFGILRHVVADAHRTRHRDVTRLPSAAPCADRAPIDHVLDREEADALRRAFDALDPGDRELLELRVLAGLEYAEIAAVLGKRPGAVRMAQSRALGRLRQHLEERS